MRTLLCLLALAATAAYAQQDRGRPLTDAERADLFRNAIVRVRADDRAFLEAQQLHKKGRLVRGIAIHQPYTLFATGVVISPDGEVVKQALHPRADLVVRVTLGDGTEVEAELVGTDPRSNLALLRLPAAAPRAHIALDDVACERGETVYIGGHAADAAARLASMRGRVGLDHTGVRLRDAYGVSQRGEILIADTVGVISESLTPYPGSACVSESGRLRGIVIGSMPYLHENAGRRALVQIQFTVPAARVVRIVNDLRAHSRVIRAWYGITFEPVREDLRAHFELPACASAITRIAERSPAARADLRVHDVLVGVDGVACPDPLSLGQAMEDKAPGTPVRLKILRNGAPQEIEITPTERET
jgi:serine protease Do